MKYWQIASGSLGRDYADDFIRFGMAFVGGAEHVNRMRQVEVGDRVLLKKGTSKVDSLVKTRFEEVPAL